MSNFNLKVGGFIRNANQWGEEFKKLRSILLECPLVEDFKWQHPCYTYENKNIVIIQGFKKYCALMFLNSRI